MSEPDDLTLMAYVDGELEPEEAARIEKTLANDPEMRKRVEKYEYTADLLWRTYEPLRTATVPQEILDLVEKKKDSEPLKMSLGRMAFWRSLSFGFPQQWVPALSSGLACGFLGILVGVGGYSNYAENSEERGEELQVALVEISNPEFRTRGVSPKTKELDTLEAVPVARDLTATKTEALIGNLKAELDELNELIKAGNSGAALALAMAARHLDLANIQKDLGQYEMAEDSYRMALDLTENALGLAHVKNIPILHKLADVLMQRGANIEANDISERAIRIETGVPAD